MSGMNHALLFLPAIRVVRHAPPGRYTVPTDVRSRLQNDVSLKQCRLVPDIFNVDLREPVHRLLRPCRMEALFSLKTDPTEPSVDLRAFYEAEISAMLDRLYGTALRLTRNPADAEDLVADTVVKALDNIDSLQDRNCFHGWIFRILYNTFNSNCRRRSARPEDSLSSLSRDSDDDAAAFRLFDKLHQPFLLWWGNNEQEFLDRLEIEDLCKAIDALPDNFRIVIALSDIEGFSYQEIADTLEIPVGTVRSRLARGRSLLQKRLWDYAQTVGLAPGHAIPPGDKS